MHVNFERREYVLYSKACMFLLTGLTVCGAGWEEAKNLKSQSSLEASTHVTTTLIDLVSLQLVSVLRFAPAAEANGKIIMVLKSTGIVNSVPEIIQREYR